MRALVRRRYQPPRESLWHDGALTTSTTTVANTTTVKPTATKTSTLTSGLGSTQSNLRRGRCRKQFPTNTMLNDERSSYHVANTTMHIDRARVYLPSQDAAHARVLNNVLGLSVGQQRCPLNRQAGGASHSFGSSATIPVVHSQHVLHLREEACTSVSLRTRSNTLRRKPRSSIKHNRNAAGATNTCRAP